MVLLMGVMRLEMVIRVLLVRMMRMMKMAEEARVSTWLLDWDQRGMLWMLLSWLPRVGRASWRRRCGGGWLGLSVMDAWRAFLLEVAVQTLCFESAIFSTVRIHLPRLTRGSIAIAGNLTELLIDKLLPVSRVPLFWTRHAAKFTHATDVYSFEQPKEGVFGGTKVYTAKLLETHCEESTRSIIGLYWHHESDAEAAWFDRVIRRTRASFPGVRLASAKWERALAEQSKHQ